MTPQLQQAIKLLQYSNVELNEFVDGELEKNPLLEKGEVEFTERGAIDRSDGDRPDGTSGEGGNSDLVASDKALLGDGGEAGMADSALDADMSENVFNNDSVSDAPMPGGDQLSYSGSGSIRGGGGSFDDEGRFEQNLEDSQTLQDVLTAQLSISQLDQAGMLIAAYLIEMVDEAGYLPADYTELAARLGCDDEDVERVIGVLQGMEPIGVFARSLQECLALQLREQDRYDPAMQALIDNIDLLAKRELGKLKKLCQVDAEDLSDMVGEIQALNPKPGLAYGNGEPVQSVVPDVFVRQDPAGMWRVELNTDTLPKVLVNGSYYAELTTMGGNKEAKAYISECYSNASWLVKALDQRARTILKVATELVKQQEAFFSLGVRHLKPLNLKAIAEAIEMHESTVSRVTANKYLGTSRGIFDMKYFFTSAISSADGGEMVSAESVRDQIRELIDGEDPKKILSDDKIVDILRAKGVDIARRTVAKYREAMNISSSVQRRRQKNIAL